MAVAAAVVAAVAVVFQLIELHTSSPFGDLKPATNAKPKSQAG